MLAVLDRRHLAHGIHRQVALALELVVSDDFRLVGLTHLLEHPADDPSTRLRVRVEDEVSHFATPCLEQSTNYSCSSACSSISNRARSDFIGRVRPSSVAMRGWRS